jgi:hypothetical protein
LDGDAAADADEVCNYIYISGLLGIKIPNWRLRGIQLGDLFCIFFVCFVDAFFSSALMPWFLFFFTLFFFPLLFICHFSTACSQRLISQVNRLIIYSIFPLFGRLHLLHIQAKSGV